MPGFRQRFQRSPCNNVYSQLRYGLHDVHCTVVLNTDHLLIFNHVTDVRIQFAAAGEHEMRCVRYQGGIDRNIGEGDHIHQRGGIDQYQIMSLPQHGHVAVETEFVWPRKPRAIAIFRNAHGRRERSRFADLFQRRAQRFKVIGVDHFLNIEPREGDPAHFP